MKRIILSLIAAAMASLLVSASAQPAPENDNTNNPPPAGQPVPPPDTDNAPDTNGPPPMPPEAENAAPEPGQTNQANEVITPSQHPPAAPEEIQSEFMPPSRRAPT